MNNPPSTVIPITSPNISIQLQLKEKWLRKEIRAVRALSFGLIKWGVTVLVAVESSLYYLRRDISEHLVKAGRIQAGELIPFVRWFLGTAFLLFLAFIFSSLVKYLTVKIVSYREQLISMPECSGIKEVQPAKSKWNVTPYLLFYAFPCIDLLLYFGFSLAKSFNIPW